MPDLARRDALQAVATTGALLLAGCSGEAHLTPEVPRRGEPVSDLEVTFARDASGESIFSHRVESDDSPDDVGRPAGADRRIGGIEYLTGADDRQRVTFSETPAGEALRTFVDATALESESIYLLERHLGECYTLALVNVVREPDGGLSADFCRELRPADVACSAEAHDTVGVAIRLPFAGNSTGGLGTRMGSRCDPHPVVAREGDDSR